MILMMPSAAAMFQVQSSNRITKGLVTVAVWLQVYKQKPVDEMADLTERIRTPRLWAVKHPVRAMRRMAR